MDDMGFKHQIGDIVKRVGYKLFSPSTECRWLVIEQILQRCHGGIQRHYLCTPITAHGSTGDKRQFTEIEVEPSGPFAQVEITITSST